MYLRVQRLHAAVEDLGEPRDVGDGRDGETAVAQLPRGASGGDELEAPRSEAARELQDAVFAIDGDERPPAHRRAPGRGVGVPFGVGVPCGLGVARGLGVVRGLGTACEVGVGCAAGGGVGAPDGRPAAGSGVAGAVPSAAGVGGAASWGTTSRRRGTRVRSPPASRQMTSQVAAIAVTAREYESEADEPGAALGDGLERAGGRVVGGQQQRAVDAGAAATPVQRADHHQVQGVGELGAVVALEFDPQPAARSGLVSGVRRERLAEQSFAAVGDGLLEHRLEVVDVGDLFGGGQPQPRRRGDGRGQPLAPVQVRQAGEVLRRRRRAGRSRTGSPAPRRPPR